MSQTQNEEQQVAIPERTFPPIVPQPVRHDEKWKKLKAEDPDLMACDEPEALDTDVDGKTQRCSTFMFTNENKPRCYTENTSKEELVLEHVLEYQRQFKIIYDPLRELLLAPLNECSKRKFICTTIRPTKLPYTELKDYIGCAKFVSSYLEYEELTEPTRFPEMIPSPTNVLEWQAGDCFDFAIVLCSLLLGTGYDAYVVYGTAPKSITTRNEALMKCPFPTTFEDTDNDFRYDKDEEQMQEKKEVQAEPIPDFKVAMPEPHRSEFDDEQHAEQRAKKELQERLAREIDDDEPDYEPDDEYGRTRLHAWVLIQKGAREMTDTFFIEPTTGRQYAIDDCPYYTIEAVFNHQNFWVNLDPTRDVEKVNLDFQEDVKGEWEYVMIQPNKDKGAEDEEDDDDDDDDEEGAEEEILDMPPPWAPKLFVNKDKFTDGCPNGEKTVFYKKCKVDFYSECKQVDGLVKRVTIYEDFKRLIVKETRSYYKNRRDFLYMRRRMPYEFKSISYYHSNPQIMQLKKIIEVDGQRKQIFYYHHRQKDGLIYREEEIERKTSEYFKNRKTDGLIYRSVTFDPTAIPDSKRDQTIPEHNLGKDVRIKKMTQKFDLNPDSFEEAENQIKKMVFDMDKDLVTVNYHYASGKITNKEKQWDRKDLVGGDNFGDNEKEHEETYESQLAKKIYDLEVACHEAIKGAEENAKKEKDDRMEFERNIQQMRAPAPDVNGQGGLQEEVFQKVLEKTIYQKARDKMKREQAADDNADEQEKKRDYLEPILTKLSLNQHEVLDEPAAIAVRNEALRSLKERLLTRAEIIQRRLEEEQKNLEDAYANLRRKGESYGTAEQENYQKEVAQANFKMDILTERASQHYRNSLDKFSELDEKLMKDPRLAALTAKNK